MTKIYYRIEALKSLKPEFHLPPLKACTHFRWYRLGKAIYLSFDEIDVHGRFIVEDEHIEKLVTTENQILIDLRGRVSLERFVEHCQEYRFVCNDPATGLLVDFDGRPLTRRETDWLIDKKLLPYYTNFDLVKVYQRTSKSEVVIMLAKDGWEDNVVFQGAMDI